MTDEPIETAESTESPETVGGIIGTDAVPAWLTPSETVISAEAARTLKIEPCPICTHNTVDGGCANCGFGLTGERE